MEEATCPGQLRCQGQIFIQKVNFLEEATCPGQLRCLGQNCLPKFRRFFEQANCTGQLRCLGQNIFSKFRPFFEQATCLGQLRCQGRNCFPEIRFFVKKPLIRGLFQKSDCFKNIASTISKHALSDSLGAWFAEQNVGNLKKNALSHVSRTQRQKSKQIHFQDFWDSCAQNITSEISNSGLSSILGLLCAEQKRQYLNKEIYI